MFNLKKKTQKKKQSLTFLLHLIILFQYIGSLDVPRPNNRMEIVAAMRRIRVKNNKIVFQIE